MLLAILMLAAQAAVGATDEPAQLVPEIPPMLEQLDPESYILGPGDVLWLSVRGGLPEELAGMTTRGTIMYMTVTPDGHAVIPGAGSWSVGGLTLAEATDVLESGFRGTFPGITASVGLAGLRYFRVPVTGRVNSPGLVTISGADRVTDALQAANGISAAGSWTSIMVIGRGDTSYVDLARFVVEGTPSLNPSLRPGDRIVVPEAESFVQLEGALHLPGMNISVLSPGEGTVMWSESVSGITEYIPGETASELIGRSGGTKSWALRDSCYVVREVDDGGEVRIPAPLDDPMVDPVLQPGDRVVCPGIPPTVSVTGFVSAPGLYAYSAGMGVEYYVSQAGGAVREGNVSGTRVTTPSGTTLDRGEVDVVPAGSDVHVPRKLMVGWQEPLLIVTSLASIVIAWKSVFE